MADDEDLELEQAARETQNEMLEKAFTPEPEKPEAEAPAERSRDERGRFARSEPAQPTAPQTEPAEEEKPEEQVPSWRLREIAEERRQAQAENDRLRAEFARVQTRLSQFEQQQRAAQQPPQPIDPVLDPQGFVKQFTERLTAEFDQRLQNMALTNDLKMAHRHYGERFERAYEAVLTEGQRGNHALVRQLASAPDAGEAIMRWFTHNEVLREVGQDIPAYKQRTREELLKDPEFLGQAVEAHRRLAAGNGQRPPNVVTNLPPSLSKATGQAEMPTGLQPMTDGSEAAIFNYAITAKRR